jgi:thioredoxin 1
VPVSLPRLREAEAIIMAGSVLEFTEDNWKSEVLESPVPVLVDFWAPWCGPCRRLTPTIEKFAEEFSGKVRVGKLDTDQYPNIATEFQISAIPTVLIFQNGQVKERLMGVNSETKYRESLANVGA